MAKLLFISLFILLSGCSTLTGFGHIDKKEKTITMPPGAGLTADLRSTLKRNGWKTMVDGGPSKTTGEIGQNVNLSHYDTFNTRYRLSLNFNQYDVCIPMFDPAYRFNISLVDNKSGEEVMNYGGSSCRNKIVRKFEAWLKSNEL